MCDFFFLACVYLCVNIFAARNEKKRKHTTWLSRRRDNNRRRVFSFYIICHSVFILRPPREHAYNIIYRVTFKHARNICTRGSHVVQEVNWDAVGCNRTLSRPTACARRQQKRNNNNIIIIIMTGRAVYNTRVRLMIEKQTSPASAKCQRPVTGNRVTGVADEGKVAGIFYRYFT